MGEFLGTNVELAFISPSGVVVRNIHSQGPHPILRVSHTNWDNGLSKSALLLEKGLYGPKTTLWVFPVARERRFEIKQLLMSEGFDRVRRWLGAPRSSTWQLSQHDLTVWFAPKETRLDYEEDNAL